MARLPKSGRSVPKRGMAPALRGFAPGTHVVDVWYPEWGQGVVIERSARFIWVIIPEQYSPELEGRAANAVTSVLIPEVQGVNPDFLDELQTCHDDAAENEAVPGAHFVKMMRDAAMHNGLRADVLNELFPDC